MNIKKTRVQDELQNKSNSDAKILNMISILPIAIFWLFKSKKVYPIWRKYAAKHI